MRVSQTLIRGVRPGAALNACETQTLSRHAAVFRLPSATIRTTATLLSAAALILALAEPAPAQQAVPIHNHTMTVRISSGANPLLPARVRSLLGVANDSSQVVRCTFDDTDASTTTGWYLAASGGNVLFDTKVPRGSLRCASATSDATIQVMEGQ